MTGIPFTQSPSKTAFIRPEQARDHAAIDVLLDLCFGPNRFAKTAYHFREKIDPIPELSYVVECTPTLDAQNVAPEMAATIRYWPLLLPDESAGLLLGPIAVDPKRQKENIGGNLMQFTLQQARALGFANCLLVGDAPYYNRFGFTRENTLGLDLPGWVELDRFLGLEWVEGSLKNQKGMLRKWPPTRPPLAQR